MIQIATGSMTDLDQLSVLFDDYRMFYRKPGDLGAARKFLHDRMLHAESVIFVARDVSGTLTGFVQLYPVFSSTRMCRLWMLNDLFVAEAYRGTGVAAALIDRAKAFSEETSSCGLVLETEKSNAVANSLYVRTGFAVDTSHNYYEWNP